MEIQVVPVTKVKPDPNQPRKYFDQEALDALAISIKNEGVINAIEVDENYIIITGEQRWRASQMAGLKDIPVKILRNLTEDERFIRQVQENIHQNTMAPLDTAMAFDKIRNIILSSTAEPKSKPEHGGRRFGNEGVKELHKLLGAPESTISQYLDLLGTTGELREALKDPTFQRSKVAAIKDAPKKFQKKLEDFIAKQKKVPRDTVRHLAKVLRRAEKYGEDHLVDQLLEQDYESLDSISALNKMNRIIPDEESRIKEPADAVKLISRKVIELMELLEKYPLVALDNFHRPLVMNDLKNLGSFLQGYFRGSKEAAKVLEAAKNDKK